MTYDDLAVSYDRLYHANPVQLRAVADMLGRLPGRARVLDLGCGSGRPVAEALVEAGHDVVGYDTSPCMLDLARQRCPAATFHQADLRAITAPPDDRPVDAVVAHLSLLHLRRVEIEHVLRRARSWLAPGGLFSLVMVDLDADGTPTTFLDRPARVSGWRAPYLARTIAGWSFEVLDVHVETFQPEGRNPERQVVVTARRTEEPGGTGMDPQQTVGIAVGRAVAAEVLAHAGEKGPRRFVLPEHAREDREAMLRSIWSDMASSGPLWSNVRVIHDGRDLHPSRFMNATLGDGLVVQSYVDTRAVAGYISDGATLVYNHLHESSQPVQRIQETLEYELGARVWIQVYVTRADRTAFGLHRDDHNFVILQLTGPKSWQVQGLTGGDDELTLRPGDGLFLRAETEHAVSGVGELAVHMTIAFDWLESDPDQPGSTMAADALAEHRGRTRVGSYLPVASAPELVDSGLTFRSASRVRPTVEDDGDKVLLRCATGTYRCPADLRPLLDLVVDGRPFTIEEMVERTDLDRATVVAFAKLAVTKGFMLCG